MLTNPLRSSNNKAPESDLYCEVYYGVVVDFSVPSSEEAHLNCKSNRQVCKSALLDKSLQLADLSRASFQFCI